MISSRGLRLVVIGALLLAAGCGGGDSLTQPPPAPPPPPPPTASLSGVVRNERDGTPVAGATISVDGVTVTAGGTGAFAVANVPVGLASIAVTAPGFDAYSRGTLIQTGANTANVTLVRVNTVYAAGGSAIYLPSEVPTVRGVFLVLYGGFNDSRLMVRGDLDAYLGTPMGQIAELASYRLRLMAFARAAGFAVMGTTTPQSPAGLHTEIRRALVEASGPSGHPELAHASLLLQGHSRGGCMVYQIAVQDPERVIGVISMAATGVEPCLDASLAVSVPGYFILGELDIPILNEAVTTAFEQNRARGAVWALASERGVGHAWTTNNDLIFNWAAAVAALRLPETLTPGAPVALRPPGENSGWLGDRSSASIAGYACFNGNRSGASWLPNEQTARDWQSVVVRPGPAPTVTVCAP